MFRREGFSNLIMPKLYVSSFDSKPSKGGVYISVRSTSLNFSLGGKWGPTFSWAQFAAVQFAGAQSQGTNFLGPNMPGPDCRGPICWGPICRGPNFFGAKCLIITREGFILTLSVLIGQEGGMS